MGGKTDTVAGGRMDTVDDGRVDTAAGGRTDTVADVNGRTALVREGCTVAKQASNTT